MSGMEAGNTTKLDIPLQLVSHRRKDILLQNNNLLESSWEICLSMRQISLREHVEIA